MTSIRVERHAVTDTPVLRWWHQRGVASGLWGSVLISIAVLTPGFVPNEILDTITPLRWVRRVLGWQVGRVLMIVGLVLLFRGWVLLRPVTHRHGLRLYAGVLALWSLPMLAAPPIFSSDAFLYADQGWIIHLGHDPYASPLGGMGGPFAENVHQVWRGTTAVYPPLALLVQYVVAWSTHFHPYWSVVAMRVPAVAAVAVMAWAVPRLARAFGADARVAMWVGVLNPLVLIHFVGGAHNDAWMVACLTVAMLAAKRWGWGGLVVGAALVGVGAAFKQPGIIAFIAVGLVPVASRLGGLTLGRRIGLMCVAVGLAGLVTGGTFVGVSLATFGFGWRRATDIGTLTWGMSPASVVEQIIGPFVRLWTPYPLLPALATVFTVCALVAVAWLAWFHFFADKLWSDRAPRGSAAFDADFTRRPVRWLIGALFAVAFSGAGFHTWYLIWGGSMFGVVPRTDRVLRWAVAVCIMAVVVQGGLEFYALWPIPGWLLGAVLGWIFLARSRHLRVCPRSQEWS